jgi:outer membrane protein OmpA-like peptidoglycan-associated protein
MTKANLGALLAVVATVTVTGCSHTLPHELADARVAYQNAARSPGAPLVPGDMMDARQSLNVAERSFSDSGDDQATRDLAYIAQRRAISAGAKADTAVALKQRQAALAELEQARRAHAEAAASELERTRTRLSAIEDQANSERQARIAAEQRMTDALSKIRDLKAEQSARGLVLTISGSVLFASGKSQILPTAQERLRSVAEALKDDQRPILIVGHTDSTGKTDMNQQLSEKRADAVKKFLIQRGIPDERLRTMGMGESEPVASNASPEGRANNRRVEIILEDKNQVGPGRR